MLSCPERRRYQGSLSYRSLEIPQGTRNPDFEFCWCIHRSDHCRAFLAQGLDEELKEFGRSITMDNVLNLPPEMIKEGAISIDCEAISSV